MNASVITPVYNTLELTMDYILSVIQWIKPPHELVMVDNGSKDQTPFFLDRMAATQGVKVVKLGNNTGFGGGNNSGAKKASGDILIFVSNDVVPTGDFITPIVAALEAEDALVGPQLLDYDTGWNHFVKVSSNFLFSTRKEITIPYIAGWCVSLRKDTFNELGCWDAENFFVDYDDMDLSYRADQMGIPIRAVAAPVLHGGFGTTASKLPGGRMRYTLQSRENFQKKWGLARI